MVTISQRLLLVCALGMAMLLSACAGVQTQDPATADEAALRERARVYWQLRIDRKLVEIYEYEAPLYREKVDLQQYISIYSGSANNKAELAGPVTIEGDLGTVEVVTTALFPGMAERSSVRDDYWQRIDNQWYHLRHRPKPKRK